MSQCTLHTALCRWILASSVNSAGAELLPCVDRLVDRGDNWTRNWFSPSVALARSSRPRLRIIMQKVVLAVVESSCRHRMYNLPTSVLTKISVAGGRYVARRTAPIPAVDNLLRWWNITSRCVDPNGEVHPQKFASSASSLYHNNIFSFLYRIIIRDSCRSYSLNSRITMLLLAYVSSSSFHR